MRCMVFKVKLRVQFACSFCFMAWSCSNAFFMYSDCTSFLHLKITMSTLSKCVLGVSGYGISADFM